MQNTLLDQMHGNERVLNNLAARACGSVNFLYRGLYV